MFHSITPNHLVKLSGVLNRTVRLNLIYFICIKYLLFGYSVIKQGQCILFLDRDGIVFELVTNDENETLYNMFIYRISVNIDKSCQPCQQVFDNNIKCIALQLFDLHEYVLHGLYTGIEF